MPKLRFSSYGVAPLILTLLATTGQLAVRPINAIAQVTPPIVIPEPPQLPEPQPLPPPEDILEDIPSPIPPAPQTPFPGSIPIKGFNIVGNTVFSNEELQQEIAEFTNQNLTFNQVLEAEAKLTQFYVSKGYINSGAVVSAQEITDGFITINVVEGTLDQIDVTVTGRLSPNYVRRRLAVATGEPFNLNRLQEALQQLQLNPLIENLAAELSVGSRRERWNLNVNVAVAPAFDPQLFIDNSRNPSVGSFQRGVQLYHGNLFGQGDRFNLTYRNTDGSNEFDGSYTYPLNASDGTLSFRYRTIDSEVIEPPFDELDIESNSRTYELTYRQPIIRNANPNFTEELALGLTASRRESDTTLFNRQFPLSLGADDDGGTRISALRFFQEWTKRRRRDVVAARSQFNLGVGAFDATLSESQPDSRFFTWRGQVQYLRQLAPDTNLLLRSDIQLSATDLVPLEQFGLGGVQSVRGYRQDAQLTDNGIFLSAEMRLPIFRVRDVQGVFSIIPFVDFGTVWNTDRRDPDDSTLVSVGIGAQWQMSDRFRARFDWGIPLVDIDSRERTWQENGLYFSVEYNPF